jgi:hypothetical protein
VRRRDAKRIESSGKRIAPELHLFRLQVILPFSVPNSLKGPATSRKRRLVSIQPKKVLQPNRFAHAKRDSRHMPLIQYAYGFFENKGLETSQ